MADPNPSIWNAANDTEITAINYGTGDAGDYNRIVQARNIIYGTIKVKCLHLHL